MLIVLFFVSCTTLLVEGLGNEDMLGKGRWYVVNLLQCEEPDQYYVFLDITRKKINRTHDVFSLQADLDRVFDVKYGIEIVAYKEVDGGYKLYHEIIGQSFCIMAKKYIGNNWHDVLTKANIDPPDCPIPKGEFKIDDYVIDYSQLKDTAMYGKFDVNIYITYIGQRVACSRWLMQFDKLHEEEDEDDDY